MQSGYYQSLPQGGANVEQQSSRLEEIGSSLRDRHITLHVTYSHTLHDREIRYVGASIKPFFDTSYDILTRISIQITRGIFEMSVNF